jgi:hypothetical protein
VVHKVPPTGPSPADITLTRPQIRDTLSLNVTSAEPNITIRNKNPINRQAAPTNQDSFNWFVDLERSTELYKFPIGATSDELKPVLTFNSGQLFPLSLSENFLLVQRGIFSAYENFGRVAVILGVDFLTTARAVFRNGDDTPIFDSSTEPGTDYVITINHDAATHPPGLISDANHYYRALGTGIPVEHKILFMSIHEEGGSGPAGPEAACFPAYLGQSNIE